jgi:hypothetical protein
VNASSSTNDIAPSSTALLPAMSIHGLASAREQHPVAIVAWRRKSE